MDRKEFLRNSCGIGVCSCLGLPFLFADENQSQNSEESLSLKDTEWKWYFTQRRLNWLVEIVENNVDAETYGKIIQQLGEKCAATIGQIAEENKGNPDGYFAAINAKWGEVFIYDKENGIIYLDTKLTECPCPNVKPGLTPKSYCECSLGWQKFMFEKVFDKPVDVSHEETILQGGKTCKFIIKVSS